MELFLTDGRHQRVIETDAAVSVAEFLVANGVEGELYAADQDDRLDPSKSLGSQGIKAGSKLIVARCRRVEVTVNFNGGAKQDSLPPGAAVAAIFAWATGKKGFDLPAARPPSTRSRSAAGPSSPTKPTTSARGPVMNARSASTSSRSRGSRGSPT